MKTLTNKKISSSIDVSKLGKFLDSCQRSNGAILWDKSGKLDPWAHTEAAMAMTILGKYQNFQRAYYWLQKNQNNDGSWYATFRCTENAPFPLPAIDSTTIESNFVAYPATGLWHYYLVTGDSDFVIALYPTIKRALNFVISMQNAEGDIRWAISTSENLSNDALITACSSILRSLECGILLADLVDDTSDTWRSAYLMLADALKDKPWRFDRTWESKARFSMDWFYPILAGIYSSDEAKLRLAKRWDIFIETEHGCRCVSDQPWVTIAESCELILALVAAKEKLKAEKLFRLLQKWQDTDGGFWTGYNFHNKQIWPMEKTSWTAAAILLAADALFEITPAAKLFTSQSTITA